MCHCHFFQKSKGHRCYRARRTCDLKFPSTHLLLPLGKKKKVSLFVEIVVRLILPVNGKTALVVHLSFFDCYIYFVCARVHVIMVRRQLSGVGRFSPSTMWLQGLNSDCQAWLRYFYLLRLSRLTGPVCGEVSMLPGFLLVCLAPCGRQV